MDILEMQMAEHGNRYIVVFADYLTKCVEAYPTPDQTAETIARLLVDNVMCQHGVPNEQLSNRGANMLSSMIQGVCDIVWMRKVNTSSYYPQSDGLVEKMNRTLRAMIAKHVHRFGHEWDIHLQLLSFAYRVKPHDSTSEAPFHPLQEGCSTAHRNSFSKANVTDADDYQTELVTGLVEAC